MRITSIYVKLLSTICDPTNVGIAETLIKGLEF